MTKSQFRQKWTYDSLEISVRWTYDSFILRSRFLAESLPSLCLFLNLYTWEDSVPRFPFLLCYKLCISGFPLLFYFSFSYTVVFLLGMNDMTVLIGWCTILCILVCCLDKSRMQMSSCIYSSSQAYFLLWFLPGLSTMFRSGV